MLQAALGCLILLGIYKFMNSESEYEIDWFIAFIFILVPAMLNLILRIGLGALELSQNFSLFGFTLYFLVPFLFLKLNLDFETKPAFKFSIVVPIVVILIEIPIVLLMGAANA